MFSLCPAVIVYIIYVDAPFVSTGLDEGCGVGEWLQPGPALGDRPAENSLPACAFTQRRSQ